MADDRVVIVSEISTSVTVTEEITNVTLRTPGVQGPPGPPGPAGGDVYTYTQTVASMSWVIVHNLGRHPGVIIYEIDGVAGRYEADYSDNSINSLTVTFLSPHTGKAELE